LNVLKSERNGVTDALLQRLLTFLQGPVELPADVMVAWRRWWQCAVHSHWALEVAYQSAVLVPFAAVGKGSAASARRRSIARAFDESQARFFVTTTSGTTTGGSWTASRCEIVQARLRANRDTSSQGVDGPMHRPFCDGHHTAEDHVARLMEDVESHDQETEI
jgi:hypothetical protein